MSTHLTGEQVSEEIPEHLDDFLNAAYYRRGVEERDVDDLRLTFSILTTYWYRQEPSRRLHATDLRSFHRAFGGDRFNAEQSSRGALNRGEPLEGADRLLGDGFGDAYADDARRAWGIGFSTVEEREAYEPEKRAGTWDRMPWHIDRAYRLAGKDAQQAFWDQGGVARLSMLHQLAQRLAG